MEVFEGEAPVNGAVEFGGAERRGDLGHLRRPDRTSKADDPGEEDLLGDWPHMRLAKMPQFCGEAGMKIDRGQKFG